MDKRQKHTLQTFRRVRDFVGRTAMDTSLVSVDTHVDALTGVIERLTVFSVEQDSRTRLARAGTTMISRQVRRLRVRYMAPIARFGLHLASLDAPSRQAMSLPRKVDAEGMVAAALGMADAAETRKATFVAGGFAEDFTERLRTAARELQASIDTRAKDRGRRSASTAGVRHELRVGRSAVRMLDTIVSPALEPSPSSLAEWRALKRQVRFASSVALVVDAPAAGSGTPAVAPPVSAAPIGTPSAPEVRAA
jgi:hypothetical protein